MNSVTDEWDAVLDRLRSDGSSPIEMIKITRAVRQVSLAQAKEIVHHSVAWSDARQDFDALLDRSRLERVDPVPGCSPLDTTAPADDAGEPPPLENPAGSVLAACRARFRERYPLSAASW